MKSALDIALERFGGGEEQLEVTAEQKAKLKAIQDKYDAKIAEVQIVLDDEMAGHRAQGDAEKEREAAERKAQEMASLRSKMEREKDKVRQGKV